MADVVVITKRHDDPWTNLVLAREQRHRAGRSATVEARYGTQAMMTAAGEIDDDQHADRIRRHDISPCDNPDDPTTNWTWTAVMRELRAVQADPVTAIEQGLAIEAIEADPTMMNTGSLILESDMPGGPNSVAGPPPAGTQFDAPPLPSLIHDEKWFSAVRGNGYHNHLLDNLDKLFADGCGAAVNDALVGLSWDGGRGRGAAERSADRARANQRSSRCSPICSTGCTCTCR